MPQPPDSPPTSNVPGIGLFDFPIRDATAVFAPETQYLAKPPKKDEIGRWLQKLPRHIVQGLSRLAPQQLSDVEQYTLADIERRAGFQCRGHAECLAIALEELGYYLKDRQDRRPQPKKTS